VLTLPRTHRTPRRRRVEIDTDAHVVYAIGDVHGCHAELVALEARIAEDAQAFELPGLIVMLGDYVDRGKESRRVLEHLIAPPPPGFRRICLAGNHDVAMLDYCEGRLARDAWLVHGGRETLFSYGLDPSYVAEMHRGAEIDAFIRANIPERHVAFLRDLPGMAYSARYVFVHAGIRPGVGLDDQQDDDLLGIREEFLESDEVPERWVIHGHTRVDRPKPARRRLGLETAAYETGRLSAVRVNGKRGRLLSS
jgi:serine/threonine protein phosphatase 1